MLMLFVLLVVGLDCRKPNEYRLVTEPTELTIVVGDDVVARIELPKEGEVKNFGLDDFKKSKAGFVIRTDWGASISHYEVQFDFRCRRNRFYLYRVKHVSLLTVHPEIGYWDKRVVKVTKPNLPIEKFVMTRYL